MLSYESKSNASLSNDEFSTINTPTSSMYIESYEPLKSEKQAKIKKQPAKSKIQLPNSNAPHSSYFQNDCSLQNDTYSINNILNFGQLAAADNAPQLNNGHSSKRKKESTNSQSKNKSKSICLFLYKIENYFT